MRMRFLTRYSIVTTLSAVAMLAVSWFNSAVLRWPEHVIVGTVIFASVVGTPILAASWSRLYDRTSTEDRVPRESSNGKRFAPMAWKLALLAAGVFGLVFGASASLLLKHTGAGIAICALGAVAISLGYRLAMTDTGPDVTHT